VHEFFDGLEFHVGLIENLLMVFGWFELINLPIELINDFGQFVMAVFPDFLE
jgi:hypothetical protein